MNATREVQRLILLVVVSHWVLDFVTHRADLPLWPSTTESVPFFFFGMGLWNSIGATYLVEGTIFAVAIVLYVRATRAADRIGSVMFWLLIAFLTLIWATQPFSPPPPSSNAIAWVGLAMWLIPLWAGWIDVTACRGRPHDHRRGLVEVNPGNRTSSCLNTEPRRHGVTGL